MCHHARSNDEDTFRTERGEGFSDGVVELWGEGGVQRQLDGRYICVWERYQERTEDAVVIASARVTLDGHDASQQGFHASCEGWVALRRPLVFISLGWEPVVVKVQ